jgi:hypothetical protein
MTDPTDDDDENAAHDALSGGKDRTHSENDDSSGSSRDKSLSEDETRAETRARDDQSRYRCGIVSPGKADDYAGDWFAHHPGWADDLPDLGTESLDVADR